MMLFTASWAETCLPDRSAEITDALMALLIGVIIALMQTRPKGWRRFRVHRDVHRPAFLPPADDAFGHPRGVALIWRVPALRLPGSEVMEWRALLRKGRRASDEAPLLGAAAVARRHSRCGPAAKCRSGPAPWFRSLVQPGTSISCCSVSDCRATEYRIEGDHYEALIGEAWFAVPADKILQRTDNPTGRAVVCWTPQRGILCFIRATES